MRHKGTGFRVNLVILGGLLFFSLIFTGLPDTGCISYADQEDVVSRAEKIAEYLVDAEAYLKKGKYGPARRDAENALKLDRGNGAARDILVAIDQAESRKRQEDEKSGRENQAQKAIKKQDKRESDIEKDARKIGDRISKAEKYMESGDYGLARRYAYEAREIDPQNAAAAEIITRADQEEIFGAKEQRKADGDNKALKALSDVEMDDPFHKYDEGKGWGDHVLGIFKKKTYHLGDVFEGKQYTIDECVELALKRSQRMVMAHRQTKLAEMRVWEARRKLLPSVTFKYEMSSGKINADNLNRHYFGKKQLAELNQTLFDGMGTWYEIRQSQTNKEIVDLENEKIENEIIVDTKKAYYNLDKAIKALAIQDWLKEKVNYLYDIAEKSHQQELVPRSEYLKIKSYNMEAEFRYTSSEEDLSLAEMILFQAMNMEPDQEISIKPVEKPGEPISIGLENCYTLALANEPDYKIKEMTIEYYDLERKMMKAKGWPKMDFQGSFGRMVERYSPMNSPADIAAANPSNPIRADRGYEPEWFAGVKTSLPFWGSTVEHNYVSEHWAPTISSFRGSESDTNYFSVNVLDNLAYFSNLEEARVGFERAKYEYLKARKDLLLKVKEQYFKYRKSVLQMGVANSKYDHQKMYMDILEERRRYGEVEGSKIIEEYDKLSEHEYGIVQTDAEYYISLAELNKEIGIPEYFKPEYENREYNEWTSSKGDNAGDETDTGKVQAK